jgi:hypothetical protein
MRYAIICIIVTTITGWIATVRTKRKMGKALGRKVNDLELTSLSTWIDVENQEDKRQGVTPHSQT